MKIRTLCIALITLLLSPLNSNGQIKLKGVLFSNNSPVEITIENGLIHKIDPSDDNTAISKTYIAPGLIDIQINGYMGVDFSGPDLTIKDVEIATKALWKTGVTSYFPTIITSDIELIKRNFAVLAKARQNPEIGKSIPGFHLEGPYISPRAGFRGAHL